MRKIEIKNRKETDVTDEALYALNKESHGMWTEQGLDAPWMHLTFPEFQQAIRGIPMFVALDAETGELLGMHSFRTHRKEGWCYGYRLAIASSARREGIASRMLTYEAERSFAVCVFWSPMPLPASRRIPMAKTTFWGAWAEK